MANPTTMRRCSWCGERKDAATDFYSNPKKRQCRACNRADQMERRRERSEFIATYKIQRGCADCGYRDAAVALQFDHRPGTEKLCDVTRFRVTGTWQAMLAEMAKCDVVCANCHAIRTRARPPAMRGHDLRAPKATASTPAMEFDLASLFQLD